jgi:hypothetical protein
MTTNRHVAFPLLLATLLTAPLAQAQTTPNNAQHPLNTAHPNTVTNGKPAAQQTPASKWHLPFFGNKQNGNNTAGAAANGNAGNGAQGAAQQQPKNFWNNMFHRNNSAPAGNGAQPAGGKSLVGNGANPGGHGAASGGRVPAGNPHPSAAANAHTPAGAGRGTSHPAAAPMRLASLDSGHATHSAAQSQALLGPGAHGTHLAQSPSGTLVRTAADGSVMETRNPKTGMVVQHGLDGSRRVSAEQPDGSRVFSAGHGVGYVQHPYLFHAQPFDHRTTFVHGQLSHQFYRPYNFGGTTLDAYAPQRFYSQDFYRSVSTRYATPLVPQWNYVSSPAPWYTAQQGYFKPESSYSTPAQWLTDFVLATSLIEAYATHAKAPGAAAAAGTAAPAASSGPAPAVAGGAAPAGAAPGPEITPDVKEKVTAEVNRQVREESSEARENAEERDMPPGSGGVVHELDEREPHVFVADADLDLVDPSGRRCMLGEGDVVQVISGASAKSGTAQAVVLASNGAGKCGRATQVDIAVSDLQEMQNHMRATIDQGLASSRAGSQAPKVTPAFAASAPPPDSNAGTEIARQQELAAAADG